MLEQTLNKKMRFQDVTRQKTIKLVDLHGRRKKRDISNAQVQGLSDELWFRYATEILRVDLRKHQKQQATAQDQSVTDERRFYCSTQSRRMFKRLMCLACADEQPRTVADIASELYITHKAASQLAKDGLSFGVIEQVKLTIPSYDNAKKLKDKIGYRGTVVWLESFMRNGARFSFLWAEELVRSRELFNEFSRYVTETSEKDSTSY